MISLLEILLAPMLPFITGMYFGGKKKKFDAIHPNKFEGERPYSGAQVGLGADQLKPISDQYIKQIMERSRGEGLVGFDPKHRQLLRDSYLMTLGEQEDERKRQDSAQAAGQGLRGGIPLQISRQRGRDFDRTRFLGLADIDIADLEANREDRNQATYAQPELVNMGANIQGQRANFDQSVWQAEQPTYVERGPSLFQSLLAAGGAAAGGYFGGQSGSQAGAAAGNALGGGNMGQAVVSPNRSMSQSYGYQNPNDLNNAYMNFLASKRRH